jgi:hypothetical protein
MGLINQKAACGLPREGCDPVEAGINLDPSGAAVHIDRPADEAQGYAVLPALEGHQARGQRGDGPGRRRAPAALVRESSCPLTAGVFVSVDTLSEGRNETAEPGPVIR